MNETYIHVYNILGVLRGCSVCKWPTVSHSFIPHLCSISPTLSESPKDKCPHNCINCINAHSPKKNIHRPILHLLTNSPPPFFYPPPRFFPSGKKSHSQKKRATDWERLSVRSEKSVTFYFVAASSSASNDKGGAGGGTVPVLPTFRDAKQMRCHLMHAHTCGSMAKMDARSAQATQTYSFVYIHIPCSLLLRRFI